MCACCQIESKTHYMYSFRGSMVERSLTFRWGPCSIPGNFIIFKLGLSPSQEETYRMKSPISLRNKIFAVYPIWWRHRVNNSVPLRIYSHHTQNCVFSNKYVEINIYSFHGSLVERPYSTRGERVQSQANTLYLNLGSLHHHHKMKLRALKINRVIFNIMHLFLPPPPHHRCIMLNHTTY